MTADSEVTKKVKLALLLIICLAAILLLLHVREILSPFLLALIMAYILHPVVRILERVGLSRRGAIAATYMLLLLVAAVGLFFLLPLIVVQINRLITSIPYYAARTQEFLIALEQQYADVVPPEVMQETLGRGITRALAIMEERLADVDAMVAAFTKIAGNIFYLILTPFLAAYMLRDGEELRRRLDSMLPAHYRARVMPALDDINRVLSGFLHGYILISVIIGTSATIMLMLMGVRFYLILGVVAGMTNLIPYFGPFIGAIPALVVAAFDCWTTVLRVALGYIVLQQLESLVVTPRILAGKTGLHPLVVVFGVMTGGTLWGIPGMILGVPTIAVIRTTIEHAARIFQETTAKR